MTTTKERILGSIDLPTELIHIPRWDQDVLVRACPMASQAYVGYMTSTRDKTVVTTLPNGEQVVTEREQNIRRNVGAVIICALDPDTQERIFDWSDAKDLREKHWNSTLIIAAKAFELAGGDGIDDLNAYDWLVRLISYGIAQDWTDEQMQTLASYEPLISLTKTPEISDDPDTAAALAAVPDLDAPESTETDQDAPDGPLVEG